MRGYTLDAHYIRFANIGFGLFNVDIYGLGLVGLESSDASAFPVVAGLVDSTPSSTQLAALAVSDLTGKDLLITFEKAEVTQDLSGWGARCILDPPNPPLPPSCTWQDDLPAGLYQVWNATVAVDGRDTPSAMPFLRAIPTAGSMPSTSTPATCSTSGRSSSSSGNSFRYMSGVRRCRTREAWIGFPHFTWTHVRRRRDAAKLG